MKRCTTLVLTGAVLASVFGLSTASANHSCDPVQPRTYGYCDRHPSLGALPLRFKVNIESRPSNLSREEVSSAVADALREWEIHWPLPTGTPTCRLMCLADDGTTSKVGVHLGDGENTISFSNDFGPCGGNSHDGIGVACVRYAGHRIVETDIVVSPNRPWYQPRLIGGPPTDPGYLVAGEVAGLYPDVANWDEYQAIGGGRGRYDLQSVITHELGHAVGLLDIGGPDAWPRSVFDTDLYQQTMYRWYYQGTTNKRTLHDGDMLGLWRIALDVMVDG